MADNNVSLTYKQHPVFDRTASNRDLSLIIGSAVLAVAAFIWLYYSTFEWLFFKWRNDEYYAHGPLLPFVSLYLIWQKRESLTKAWRTRDRINWTSPLLLCFGLLLFLGGAIADVQFVQAASFPFVLLGVARFLGGAAFARPLRFPLLFLLMSVPLSGMLVQTVTVPMQNLAAACAGLVLGMLGLSVERVGVNLYTPHYNFIVAVACSGLKITITLLTAEMLIAYMLPRLSNMARFLLILLTIPISLFTNALRIIIIVLIGCTWGPQMAEGFLHNFSGVFMFGLSLALLLARSNAAVKAGMLDTKSAAKAELSKRNSLECPIIGLKPVWMGFSAVAALLTVTYFVGSRAMTTKGATTLALNSDSLSLSRKLDMWQGQPSKVDKIVYEVLHPDAVAQTRYCLTTPPAMNSDGATKSAAPTVEALVIYSRQWKNFHSPVMCLRAGGWEIGSEEKHQVHGKLQGKSKSLTLNLLTAERREGKMHLAYCFIDTNQEVSGWLPTMAKLVGARLLSRSAGVAEVQFAFDPRMMESNGEFKPELTHLILQVSAEVQKKLQYSMQPSPAV